MGFESTELGPTESGQLNGDDFFFTSHHQAKRKSLSTTGCATRVARDGGGGVVAEPRPVRAARHWTAD
jgi:hypothetical protein